MSIAIIHRTCGRIAVGGGEALAQVEQPTAGLAALEEIPATRVADYQPYWAARGHILRLLDQKDEAGEAFSSAGSLTDDQSIRDYLLARRKLEFNVIRLRCYD